MDIQHPWTKYEVARLRNEERLLRARDAMRALEVREEQPTEPTTEASHRLDSLLDRVWRHKARAAASEARPKAI
jgi:hypothetical protein